MKPLRDTPTKLDEIEFLAEIEMNLVGIHLENKDKEKALKCLSNYDLLLQEFLDEELRRSNEQQLNN